MQIRGIIYEINTLQELFQAPSYMPQGSKAYYFCRQDNKMYEIGFNGQYEETKDFDNFVATHRITKKMIEDNKIQSTNETSQLTNIKIDDDVKSTIEYLSKHIYNVNFKVDEVIKMFNPSTLPSDILTRYNPDTIKKQEEPNNNVIKQEEAVNAK